MEESINDKNQTLTDGSLVSRAYDFSHDLPELIRLRFDAKHLTHPISLRSFEMLEAELQNQGILPRPLEDQFLLSSLASQEATFWRWRATRYGAKNIEINFFVDVPRYVLERARELEELLRDKAETTTSPWKFSFRTHTSIKSELSYLEKFASYINGAFDNSENGFQRGLSLILQVIEQNGQAPENEVLSISIPTSKEAFIDLISPYRDTKKAR